MRAVDASTHSHDGEKPGRARGIADGLRLLSLDESIDLYMPGVLKKTSPAIAALIASGRYTLEAEHWPFAVGKEGRLLTLCPDDAEEPRVVETTANEMNVIADSLVDWLEAPPV